MTSRYETRGGVVSEDDAIMLLIKRLREAAEAAYDVSHINKDHSNTNRGEGFRRMGQNLEQMSKLALTFATRSGRA